MLAGLPRRVAGRVAGKHYFKASTGVPEPPGAPDVAFLEGQAGGDGDDDDDGSCFRARLGENSGTSRLYAADSHASHARSSSSTMASSCSEQRQNLLACLADSPCVAAGRTLKECMEVEDGGCKGKRSTLNGDKIAGYKSGSEVTVAYGKCHGEPPFPCQIYSLSASA